MNKIDITIKEIIKSNPYYIVDDDELQRKYSTSILDLKTIDWEHRNWTMSDDEVEEVKSVQFIPKGVWKEKSPWEKDYNFIGSWSDVGVTSTPVRVTRSVSASGRLERFIGRRSFHASTISLGGKDDNPSTRIRVPRDHTPLSGMEKPRFVWRVESDTDLFTNRRVQVAEFNDTSVLEARFRVRRKNAPRKAEQLIGAEDEENIEDLLSLEVLEALGNAMGKKSLTLEEYKLTCSVVLKIPIDSSSFPSCLLKLFIKIDTFGVGRITWDDLCDFLQQKFAEKAETDFKSPPVQLFSPVRPFEEPHKSPITRAITLPDKGLLCFSQDGIISLWTSSFKPRIWRALGRYGQKFGNKKIINDRSNKWYTDVVYIQKLGKLFVPTGEKELQVYDTSSYDPYCQVIDLHSVSLRIDAKMVGLSLVIVMGDMNGVVTVLIIEEVSSTLRHWSQQRRTNNIPSIKVEEAVQSNAKYIKFQVHHDIITHVQFSPSLNKVFSCSMDKNKSLVMGTITTTRNSNEMIEDISSGRAEGASDVKSEPKQRKSQDEVIFPITNGCRTFDLWEEKKWLAAGGLDRIIWVWNVFVPSQPIAKLRGHNAAIFKVIFDIGSETLFSICTEKTIKVWNLYTNTCIHTLDTKLTGIRGPTLHCFYPSVDGVLVQTSDQAAYLRLERKDDTIAVERKTHTDPIVAIIYNHQHEYIMTCSRQDIRVWDCETGELIAEFNTIGGDGSMHLETLQENLEKPMEEENIFITQKPLVHGREQVDTYNVGTVTATALDNMGRRFFTAHENGVIKAWNFYNGRNLYNLYKPKNNLDICDMHYVTIDDDHRYLITVGWDRKVVVYIDSHSPELVYSLTMPDEPIQFTHETLGHKDDIWACSFGVPNLIASGDFGGKLLVWNINSGHIVAYLKPNPCRDHQMVKVKEIISLSFHQNKYRNIATNYLISSGPYHLLHIWRANTTRELNIGSVGWNRPVSVIKDCVTSIKSSKSNNFIATADTSGYVTIWQIDDKLGTNEPTTWFSKRYLAKNAGKDKYGFRPPGAFGVTQVYHPDDKKKKLLRLRRRLRSARKKSSYQEEDDEDIESEVDEDPKGENDDEESENEESQNDSETEPSSTKSSSMTLDEEEEESGDEVKMSFSEQLKRDIEETQSKISNDFGEKSRRFSEAQMKQLVTKKKGYGLGPVQLRMVKSWKCHTEGFTLEIAETYGLVITGGRDRTVRLWDLQGNFIGILGQPDKWLIGDQFSYAKQYPSDVILDLKRIRGMNLFSSPPPPKLPIEIAAEKVTKRLLERTEKHTLTEKDIWQKALAYEKLLALNVPTTTWYDPDSPVGNYQRIISIQEMRALRTGYISKSKRYDLYPS